MAAAAMNNMGVVLMMVAVLAAAVSAQDFAPAPAPSMDKGAAFSVAVPAAVVCSSLFFSMLALFKH